MKFALFLGCSGTRWSLIFWLIPTNLADIVIPWGENCLWRVLSTSLDSKEVMKLWLQAMWLFYPPESSPLTTLVKYPFFSVHSIMTFPPIAQDASLIILKLQDCVPSACIISNSQLDSTVRLLIHLSCFTWFQLFQFVLRYISIHEASIILQLLCSIIFIS